MSLKILVKYASLEAERHVKFAHAIEDDAGYDLYNGTDQTIVVKPGEMVEVPSGISLKVPSGYYGHIGARSSTWYKKHLFVMNAVIDAGYVGPLFVCVCNLTVKQRRTIRLPGFTFEETKDQQWGESPVIIKPWERIAQMLILPVPVVEVIKVDELPKTKRGTGGFGHTG